MRNKIKFLLIGFILGSCTFNIFATVNSLYDIIANPYRIMINGKETTIEGYNINGYSYFKLRDIGTQTKSFNVDFKEDMILIDTINATALTVDDETSSSNNVDVTEKNIVTIDTDIYAVNDEKYFYFQYINNNLLSNTFITAKWEDSENYSLVLCNKNNHSIILEPIPFEIYCEHAIVSEDYFNNYILPLDNLK